MRTSPYFEGGHAMLDLGLSEPNPWGFKWERRDTRVAEGASWIEVLVKLPPFQADRLEPHRSGALAPPP